MKFVKRLLVITAACAMILSLASCGNGDSNKATDTMKQTEPTSASDSAVTNEPSASDEIGNNVDDVKKQAEAIEESRESLRALIGKASTLSSEEDIAAWGKEFSDIKNDLEEKTKTLSDTIANAPEEYQESYGKISDAATAAYDAMAGFESAVTSAVCGDVSEFKSKVSDFSGKMGDADKLWDNAEVR